jgi:hypothetical protein
MRAKGWYTHDPALSAVEAARHACHAAACAVHQAGLLPPPQPDDRPPPTIEMARNTVVGPPSEHAQAADEIKDAVARAQRSRAKP